MLNEYKKEQFISERFSDVSYESHEYYLRIMYYICEIEHYYQKDLDQFSVDQLNGLLDKLSTNYRNYLNYKRIICNYLEWCGVDTRPTMKFTKSIDISRRYYDTFENFYYDIRHNLDLNQKSADAFHGLMLILIWLGFTKDDIFTLKKTDVDYKKELISTSSGFSRAVDNRIICLCRLCASIDKFDNKGGYLVDNEFMFRKMESSATIENEPIAIHTMHHAIDKFNKVTGRKCTFNTIRKSGLFEYLRGLERDKLLNNNSPATVWRDYIGSYFQKQIRDIIYYKQDYFAWKRMFEDFSIE